MTEPTAQMMQREADVFAAIVEAFRQTGLPPTVRELCIATRIPSTSLVDHYLGKLVRGGRIKRVLGLARGIWPVMEEGRCPTCGAPREAQQWRCEG